MAEESESAESSDLSSAQVETQLPLEKMVPKPQRRGPRSVLNVSQLLLRAIASHKGLTLATLKRELGNAGYEVRRNTGRHAGETSRPEGRGTLLRVSGSEAAGYFRVWKTQKPKRKTVRPSPEEGTSSPRGTSSASRRPRRRRPRRRKAAKKAREVRRRNAKADLKTKRQRPRNKSLARPRAREEARATVAEEGRPATAKEMRLTTREDKRPGSKQREEKDCETSVKGTVQNPTPAKSNRTSSRQAKIQAVKAAHTKASKSETSQTSTGSP